MGEMVLGRGEREGLVARLFAAFAMQVRDVEARVREGAQIGEDTKILAGLAKTLETLLSLDRRVSTKEETGSHDVEGLRAQVIERLKSLRRAPAATPA